MIIKLLFRKPAARTVVTHRARVSFSPLMENVLTSRLYLHESIANNYDNAGVVFP